jgi:hypothetical protein
MPKAKMVNIAKINDFETLSKETGISVADLKAMQRELKSGTMALPRANEAETNTTDFQGPTQRPGGTYNVDYLREGRKSLKENKEPVMIDGKEVNVRSIVAGNVDHSDYPDFADAYADSAEFMDGTPLSDDQLSQLDDMHSDLVQMAAHDSLYEGKRKRRYNALAEWKKLVNEGAEEVIIDGKPVFVSSIEVDGFDPDDPRDLSDIYATYAEFEDGTPLTDDQLSDLDDKYPHVVRTAAIDYLSEGKRQNRRRSLNETIQFKKKDEESFFVNGKEVDFKSIVFERFRDSHGEFQYYAHSARYKDRTILDEGELDILNSEYFDDNQDRFSDSREHLNKIVGNIWDY